MTTATYIIESNTYAAAEAEWFAAVEARNAFDAQRARWTEATEPKYRGSAARSWGARRAPLTRRIIAAEQEIERLRQPIAA